MRDVSIYIPCYNAEKHIQKCIESILQQSYPIHEILVVDDGSTDQSMDIVRKYPHIRIVTHDKNLGLACARNTGWKNLNSEYIANIDADCIANPDWLEHLMENFIDKTIAGVGGALYETYTCAIPDYWRAIHMKQFWGSEKIINPDWLYGHSAVYQKYYLDLVQGYNEKYRTNYEDLDLSTRILDKGYNLVYEPKSIVHHLRQDSSSSVLRTRWRWTALGVHGPVTGSEIIKNTGRNLGRSAKYILQDFHQCRYSLLGLDFALGFYSIYADLRSLKKP